MSNLSNTDCIQGWVELLYFEGDPKALHDATPSIMSTDSLINFKESHYAVVGSPIPLCEYYSSFEIYRQYAGALDPEFGIPRSIREYDAINLCVNDPKFGKRITTMVVWPKGQHHKLKFRKQTVQFDPNHDHCLVVRQQAFKSFLCKDFEE